MPAPFDHSRGLLRPGVTGFGGSGERPIAAAEFKAACMHALRRTGAGRWLAAESPGPGRNHHRTLIELTHTRARVWLLLNLEHPLLAFADAVDEQALKYRFLDLPALADGFDPPFECVPAAVLDAPFDLQATARGGLLDPTALAQARYWRPARFGELVFNHWD